MTRRRNIYRETYNAGAVKFSADHLPQLWHQTEKGDDFVATGAELLAAGIVEENGERREYQDIRIFVTTMPATAKPRKRK